MLAGTRLANVWEETAVAAPSCRRSRAPTRKRARHRRRYLGLSAALHLADAGVDVLVVDAEQPGWGASGRNGGQVIPGLKHDPSELEAMLGHERGERVWRFAGGVADFVFDLVDRHKLDCNARRATWIQGIHSPKAKARALRRVDDWVERARPSRISTAHRSRPSPAPTSILADSPTTVQARCSHCRTRANWRGPPWNAAHAFARARAS
jgi:glycine/D-amino acid oxidase-like deaminating enzyme